MRIAKLITVIVTASLLFASQAMAAVRCPNHANSTCTNSWESRVADDGGTLYRYDCTCGDSVWVRG